MCIRYTYFMNDLPDRLFIDLAIGTASFEDTCGANGVDPAWVNNLAQDIEFQHRLLAAKQAVEDDGRAFRARCRSVVHDSIPQMEFVISDREVPASSRIEAFKILAKLGGLEPLDPKNAPSNGPALSLTIIAPGGERIEAQLGNVIEHEPNQQLEGLQSDDLIWVEA